MKQNCKNLVNDGNIVLIIEDSKITAFHKITKECIDLGSIKDMDIHFSEVRDCFKLAQYHPEEFIAQARIAAWIFNNKESKQKKDDDIILTSEVLH